MPGFIGVPELMLLGLVVLLVFGPKRLPEMGRSLGRGMREFKDSVTNDSPQKDEERKDEEPKELRPAETVVRPAEPVTVHPAEPVAVAPREREEKAA